MSRNTGSESLPLAAPLYKSCRVVAVFQKYKEFFLIRPAAVTQWFRVFAPHANVVCSNLSREVVKTSSDSSTTKPSAIGVVVTGPQR